jgi:Protein of unknown function (DUF1559)
MTRRDLHSVEYSRSERRTHVPLIPHRQRAIRSKVRTETGEVSRRRDVALGAAMSCALLVIPALAGGTSTGAAAAASRSTMDVDAGGPYRASVGRRVELVGRVAAAGQGSSVEDLRAIGQALLRYRDANGAFPPSALTSPDGKVLLSWRVLLLPYLGQGALYQRFDLTKPWDDPTNQPLLQSIPAVFRGRGAKTTTNTAYVGVAGGKQLFQNASAKLDGGMTLNAVSDGATMTIAVGPAGSAVNQPWTAPGDIDLQTGSTLGDSRGFAGIGGKATPMLFLDGSVRTIPNSTDALTVHSWSTIAGGGCSPPEGIQLNFGPSWDLDNDGTFETTGRTTSFLADKPGSRKVRFRAIDDNGVSVVRIATVVVR